MEVERRQVSKETSVEQVANRLRVKCSSETSVDFHGLYEFIFLKIECVHCQAYESSQCVAILNQIMRATFPASLIREIVIFIVCIEE
jgi:hypothetical protein